MLWDTVLQRFNNTSKALQCATLDLNNAVRLLNSLQDFVSSLRSEFDDFEEQGKELVKLTLMRRTPTGNESGRNSLMRAQVKKQKCLERRNFE